jgi:hypothetical protein
VVIPAGYSLKHIPEIVRRSELIEMRRWVISGAELENQSRLRFQA